MSFAQRLAQVRKSKGISQEELAEQLGTKGPAIGRYERGAAKPTIEVAAKIARFLGVSLDYLTGLSDQLIDQDMIKQINELQLLPSDEQQHILKTLHALIRDAKASKAYK